jgi:uncharacterized protein YlxW (UPF0749 family)
LLLVQFDRKRKQKQKRKKQRKKVRNKSKNRKQENGDWIKSKIENRLDEIAFEPAMFKIQLQYF